MKKKLTYCILVLAALASGCTKLEDKSYSLIISDDFEPTAKDISSLVGAAYGNWRQLPPVEQRGQHDVVFMDLNRKLSFDEVRNIIDKHG